MPYCSFLISIQLSIGRFTRAREPVSFPNGTFHHHYKAPPDHEILYPFNRSLTNSTAPGTCSQYVPASRQGYSQRGRVSTFDMLNAASVPIQTLPPHPRIKPAFIRRCTRVFRCMCPAINRRSSAVKSSRRELRVYASARSTSARQTSS